MAYIPHTLSGRYVSLEPLSQTHQKGLIDALYDGNLWEESATLVPSPELVATYISLANKACQAGSEIPFAILEKGSHTVIGSTKLQKFADCGHTLEIGSTFIRKSFQKSPVNRESKLILLSYAFESLNIDTVRLVTTAQNSRSLHAISALGATCEDHFLEKSHMPSWENQELFSFIIPRTEWQQVKEKLSQNLYNEDGFRDF